MQEELINQFCSYFDEKIFEIDNLNNPLYKNILIIILMDTLSRVWTQGIENKNKIRFVRLIRECIQWEYSDRVSIPIAHYRLNEITVNHLLKDKINQIMGNLQKSAIHRLDIDPLYLDIIKLGKNKDEMRIIKQSTHSELLYSFRNSLIHEFRKPGRGMEFSNDNESPYYHGMTDFDFNKKTWELVYPTKFLINLAKIALKSIKIFLTSKGLNPYSFFEFGSPW
jgi:hypothetical protein